MQAWALREGTSALRLLLAPSKAALPSLLSCVPLLFIPLRSLAQPDTLLKHIALDEVVISAQATGFDVEAFVRRVRTDTTFHKAFLNTRVHPHRVRSDVRVRRKDER